MKDTNKNSDLPELFQKVDWEGENTLSYHLRGIIFQGLKTVIGDKIKLDLTDVKTEHPKAENYGDYSTNVALVLAGRLKTAPMDLAKQLVDELNKYIIKHQSTSGVSDSLSHQDGPKSKKFTKTDPKVDPTLLESASVAGPGFVNVTIRKDYLITLMTRVIKDKKAVRTSSLDTSRDKHPLEQATLPLTGKKIMVEFAHPNTHKEFHIGHLRNISIGESIVRTLEQNGAQLFRANYEGDIGLHVAKAIWGVRKKIQNSEFKIQNLRELNPANKAKFLGEGYALGSKMYEENESVKKEIIELNKAIYKDPKKIELWEETRRWSLEYFDTVYHRVGSHFDRLFFESEVEGSGRAIVIVSAQKGIFIKDKDGSIYFPGSKYGLNDCVFVTREGYATYEGKEIACEELEYKTFPYDLSINNVANEQSNFFQISYKATELLFPSHKGKHFHLAYGMVNFKSGKLSSRTGEVVTADWLIDQAKEKIKEIMKQTIRKDMSAKNDPGSSSRSNDPGSEHIAEKVAVAAVKYSMLKVNPRMDIAFDLEDSVTFEGDSGPYLLYTYARCKSVLRKSGKDTSGVAGRVYEAMTPPMVEEIVKRLNPEELSLLRTLYRFPEVVTEAGHNLSPNVICTFLFDLAQKYNLFYNKHSILNPESDKNTSANNDPGSKKSFRLALTEATSKILHRGLYLLGIETVERM